jgi:acyl-CoA thioester hydrolase
MTRVGVHFTWPVRVYYEDTDAAGIVYYANYLRFMERARTEWLAAIGWTLDALAREHHAMFVVHRVEVDFRSPARLGDLLAVSVELRERRGARLLAKQRVTRDDEPVADAQVTLALLDCRNGHPIRLPPSLAARMEIPTP